MQNIDIYYESLKQVYDQMVQWKAPKPPLRARMADWLTGFLVVCLLLSIVPVLPAIVLYLGSQFDWVVWLLDLTEATFEKFTLVWILLVVITLVTSLFVGWMLSKFVSSVTTPTGPPQSLSPEQLTFIAVYEAYKELKIFFVSHIDNHVDNSLRALKRVLPGRERRGKIAHLYSPDSPDQFERVIVERLGDKRHGHIFPAPDEDKFIGNLPKQISIARSFLRTFEQFAWFQLDVRTKAILQALLSLQEKLPYRLKEREDLPAVLSILDNLSKFTYAYLPEHKTYMDAEALKKLQTEGSDCLQRFVEEVTELTTISLPEQKKSQSNVTSISFREKYHHIYNHYVFVRFTMWFVVILLLTSAAVFLINQVVKLSADTMATVVIGTSVASAAALAGFLPKTSKPD